MPNSIKIDLEIIYYLTVGQNTSYLYLYLYSAGTDHGYKCTGRRAVGLVQLLEGPTKALWLCYTVFPHTSHYAYTLSSRWFQSIVFEKNEFFLMSVLHWMSLKDLELFTVCRSIIFDVSNPSYCLAFLFLFQIIF